jgi:uncharacterized protein
MNKIIAILFVLYASGVSAATPLIRAINQQDTDTALSLIEAGANVNEAEVNGTTPLHWAAHHGNLAIVQRLLRAEANINQANDYGSTPIYEAVFQGDQAVVKALLDAGADVDSPNSHGQTNLMVAARTENVALARLLLDRGANVNARETRANQTALMWAVAKNNVAMTELLLEHGADPNAQSIMHDWDRRVTSEPRVKYQPTGGFTPLLFAARENCQACVVSLLAHGADIDMTDPDGTTALNLAIQNGHYDLAKLLIEQGADVNLWDWWGRGPLYSAIDMNTLPKGGRVDLPSLDQTLPVELVAMLLARGANPNLQIKFLVPFRNVGADRGGDLVLITGSTPLLRAAKAGDVEVVRMLLEYDAMTELHTYGNWLDWAGGTRPLAAAAGLAYQLNDTRGQDATEEQAIEIIDLLLAAGADINAQDNRGRTAVHGAVFRGWDQVLIHLAKRGANLTLADFNGQTPLDAAMGKIVARNRETININDTSLHVLNELLRQSSEESTSESSDSHE